MAKYRGFLKELRTCEWGELLKCFVFPVYGFGYKLVP